MTPTHPLTPTEHAAIDAALKAACATFDTQRINRINDLRAHETCAMELYCKCDKENLPYSTIAYLRDASAYHLAAALLAGQMAERL